ncbi:hypothetical protein ACFQPA_05230 [Halomarina halobia]|uniref:Uncharacterized protein n=1 Tax=Halomarina halobia TaxID=3033386 RepID=A0ABD6A782_9EURY|nr:hypothetical protein [Halomarina sp. PSR21]
MCGQFEHVVGLPPPDDRSGYLLAVLESLYLPLDGGVDRPPLLGGETVVVLDVPLVPRKLLLGAIEGVGVVRVVQREPGTRTGEENADGEEEEGEPTRSSGDCRGAPSTTVPQKPWRR